MARDFDGTADYLECTTAAPINALPVTMACWFNSDNDTTELALMCIGTNGGNARVQLTTAGHVGGDPVRAAVAVTSGFISSATTSAGFMAGVWSHAAGVFTSTTSRTAYCDGSGVSATGTYDPVASGWDRVLIGARRNSTSVGAFSDSRIAEAGIWNVALSQAEIGQLAAGYSPLIVRPESLVFYAPLHGRNGAAGDEEDWIGGLTLTQVSSPALGDHPRIIYPGRGRRVYTPSAAVAGFRAAWVPRASQFIGAR